MTILPVTHQDFVPYGRLLEASPFTQLLTHLKDTPLPGKGVVYQPAHPALEALPAANYLRDVVYGGMPIQIGYCNGVNNTLTALEYHRGSEVNIAATDIVLLLAQVQCIRDAKLDTSHVRAFSVPAGTAVLLYETTLHYAPCGDGFQVAIVLPQGTNLPGPTIDDPVGEDKFLLARNKWLLAYPDSPEATHGAAVGLVGDLIRL